MIRLLAVAFAVVLSAAPVMIMPVQAVAVIALVGLLLVTVGVATFWRWPVTAAACVFLADYATALWATGGPVNIAGAAGFGLALLFMLESGDLARRVRRAAVEGAVIRSHLGRWSGFGAATLAAAALAVTLASALATPMPPAIAPLLAAGGALGVITTIAVMITRVTLTRRSTGR
jgi:hypothetical protein